MGMEAGTLPIGLCMEGVCEEQCPAGGLGSEGRSLSQQKARPRKRREGARSVQGLRALGVKSRGKRCREGALRMPG